MFLWFLVYFCSLFGFFCVFLWALDGSLMGFEQMGSCFGMATISCRAVFFAGVRAGSLSG